MTAAGGVIQGDSACTVVPKSVQFCPLVMPADMTAAGGLIRVTQPVQLCQWAAQLCPIVMPVDMAAAGGVIQGDIRINHLKLYL